MNSKHIILAAAFALSLAPLSPARSQDVLDDCAKDIEQFCSQVTIGNGRLLACMYAHEDKISDACDMAIGEAADQIDWFLANLREAVSTCAEDIQKHCSDVAAGQGRIYACLKVKRAEITPACQGVVDEVTVRLTSE